MNENIKQEDIHQPLPSEGENKEKVTNTTSTEQDPLKTELEKVQKGGRSKREKLLFTKQRVEDQLSELDKEEGIELDEDDKPVTVGMLKKIQTETATKTALQLADEITDETERELTKFHIENTIRPTGDPKRDLELAQVHVNAVKNKQIVQEITRRPDPKKLSSSGGSNPREGVIEEELTPDEIAFTKPPFNMSKDQILKARQ